MFSSGRFILTGNGLVLSEQCSDGFTIVVKPRYNCIDAEWVEIDNTNGTCEDLGNMNSITFILILSENTKRQDMMLHFIVI